MINGKHYVVASSDASTATWRTPEWYRRTGYAYYIRDDEGTTKHAWYSEQVDSASDAEVTSALGALEELIHRDYPPNTKLIFYCDNMKVIDLINGSFVNKRTIKRNLETLEFIQAVTAKFEEVEARHVKGHTDGQLKRHYMNDWCDINSRAMRKYKKYFDELDPAKKKATR